MSLWYCDEHGLVGPQACCPKASWASLEQASSGGSSEGPPSDATADRPQDANRDRKVSEYLDAIKTLAPVVYEALVRLNDEAERQASLAKHFTEAYEQICNQANDLRSRLSALEAENVGLLARVKELEEFKDLRDKYFARLTEGRE